MSAGTTPRGAAAASPLLAVTDGEFSRGGGFRVLVPTLEVRPGEFVAVIGPNGSGKSTLLRGVAGLLDGTDTSTAVRLGGEPLASLKRVEVARRLAFLSQHHDTTAAFRVREIVEMGREPHRARFGPLSAADARHVDLAIGVAGLGALVDRPIDELSGGERQRVFLARAFAQGAPLLVLDEPTSHLDLAHAYALLGLVRERVRTCESAALVAIHDLALAAHFADRFLLLKDGQVVEAGAPAEVLTEARLREVFGVEAHVAPGGEDGLGPTVQVRGVVRRTP